MSDVSVLGKLKPSQIIGFFVGIAVVIFFWFVDVTPGLLPDGRRFLGFLLTSVIWWATKPIAPPLTALFLMTGTLTFGLAPVDKVAAFGASPNMFLYFAAFVMADVVDKSGIGKRVAYFLSIKVIKGWTSLIVSAFVTTFVLSFLIPHPFPRAFLLLAIFKSIGQACGLNDRDSSIVGFSVFAASCPISTMTLTGDGGLNVNIAALVGGASWMDWTIRMFIPGLVATFVFIAIFLILLKPTGKIEIKTDTIREELAAMGKVTRDEKVTLFWTLIAVLFWVTQPLHHISTFIIAIVVIVLMAMPYIGGVAKAGNFNSVEFGGLLYIIAAFSVGQIAGVTGLSPWLAATLLPASVPSSPFVLFLLIAIVTVVLHFFLGSCVSTASVLIPTFLAFTVNTNLNPICIGLVVYTCVYLHWFFPFQSMNLMVGLDKAKIVQADIFKVGIPMTVVIFGIVLIEAALWSGTGLLYVA
jgi:di/tricarboxylate transporter